MGGEREADDEGHHDGEGHGHAVAGEEHRGAPLHQGEGEEDDDERERGGDHGQRDLAGAIQRRLHRRAAPLLHHAMDVLEHHDRVVDDHAHGKGKAQHGRVVEGVAHRLHEGERAHDGGGDGERRDERAAQVVKERENGQRHEDHPEDEVERDLVEVAKDEPGLVSDDLDAVVGRQEWLELAEASLHGVDERHRVAPALLAHHERDRVGAVQPGERARLLHAVRYLGDLRKVDGLAARARDDEAPERRHRLHPPQRAQHQLAPGLLHAAARHLHVLRLQRRPHVLHRQPVRPQAVRVEGHLHGAHARAHEVDGAHVGHGLEVLLEELVREEGDLLEVARRGHRERQDGGRIDVELVHDGGLGAGREAREDGVDLVADVLGRKVAVALVKELGGDAGEALAAVGAQLVKAGDGVDDLLEWLGDGRLDLLGRGPPQRGRHGDDRQLDVGDLVNAELRKREQAHHHEQQVEHRGEHGPANA